MLLNLKIDFYFKCEIKFAVSIALLAASAPLLPAFVPARSIACSILSVVKIPKITGMPSESETAATPFETSAQT